MSKPDPGLRIETLFGLETDGIMRDRLTGARVFVMSRNGWSAFYSELDSTFSGTAPVILERIGYAYGKLIGTSAVKLGMGTSETFQALFDLAEAAGWGKMVLTGGDLAQGVGMLRIKRCIFCESLVSRKVDSCHFLPGVIRGVAEEVTGKPHTVNEASCICRGNTSCEIQIRLVGQ